MTVARTGRAPWGLVVWVNIPDDSPQARRVLARIVGKRRLKKITFEVSNRGQGTTYYIESR